MRKSEVQLKDIKIRLTPNQFEWVRVESERTGESISSCIRKLIQNQIDVVSK